MKKRMLATVILFGMMLMAGCDDKKEAVFSFNLRLNVNDPYLINENNSEEHGSIIKEWCSYLDNSEESLEDVRFRIYIEKKLNEETWETVLINDKKESVEFKEFSISDIKESDNIFLLNECGWVDWYDKCRIIWKNIGGKITGLDGNEIIRIRMIPLLSEKDKYKIVYNNLEQSLIFDLTKINDENWDIGNSYYKFYLDEYKNSQIISFNVSGPLITKSITKYSYSISDINGETIVNDTVLNNIGIGDNLLKLSFAGDFKKENIYVINFKIKDESDNEMYNKKRLLITSEIFNRYQT